MSEPRTTRIELHADEIDAVIDCLSDPITAVRELLLVTPAADVRATLENRLGLLLRVQSALVQARAELPAGLPLDAPPEP